MRRSKLRADTASGAAKAGISPDDGPGHHLGVRPNAVRHHPRLPTDKQRVRDTGPTQLLREVANDAKAAHLGAVRAQVVSEELATLAAQVASVGDEHFPRFGERLRDWK